MTEIAPQCLVPPGLRSLLNHQVVAASERLGSGNLAELLSSGTTWEM